MAKSLCSSCTKAQWCPTWAEWKCVKRGIRFTAYGYVMPTKCSDYVKRGSDFKEPPCQCKDCTCYCDAMEE